MRYTVDVIAGLAFGSDVNTIGSDDDVIQRHLNLIFPATRAARRWRRFRTGARSAAGRSRPRARRARRQRGDRGFIAERGSASRASRSGASGPRNLLEAMIVAAERRGGEIARRDIAGNVFVMLVAGEDTTANTLAWLLDFLFRHPEACARARRGAARRARHRAFTLEQIGELPSSTPASTRRCA